MQITERDGTAERMILTACIVSREFLGRVVGRAGNKPFRSQWSNEVYSWCEEFYRKYGDSPGKKIETVFAEWSLANKDKDLFALLNRFLSSLSEEYAKQEEKINLNFLLDKAQRLFNEIKMQAAGEQEKLLLDRGEVQEALDIRKNFQPVDLLSQPPINVMEDRAAIQQAIEAKQKILVKYSGAAGKFFGSELSEDSFVGLMAPPKGMKSFTMLDIAWRAMLQGRKIAYFQVGDLSQDQIMRRFITRAVYRPLTAGRVYLPVGIMLPPGREKELAILEKVEREYANPIPWSLGATAFQRIMQKTGGRIRLSWHSTMSVSVADIRSILNRWDEEGWNAKVVVIDYAGNLSPVDRKANMVDQITYSWAMMRQISEERKCLVVTGQQSNAEGFKTWVLTKNNFSGSKLILAHVTAFYGINMTNEEKARGIVRYNTVNCREAPFVETDCLYLGAHLAACNIACVSTMPSGMGEG